MYLWHTVMQPTAYLIVGYVNMLLDYTNTNTIGASLKESNSVMNSIPSGINLI